MAHLIGVLINANHAHERLHLVALLNVVFRKDHILNFLAARRGRKLLHTIMSAGKDSDALERAAESFIENVYGIERGLLSKSLQETLIHCSGFAVDLTQNELRKRVRQFLKRESSAFMLRRFLSSYFFNFIWFQTGEAFRTRAWTRAEFENAMKKVEAYCKKIVAETFKSCERTRRPPDVAATRRLIRTLEERLRSKP